MKKIITFLILTMILLVGTATATMDLNITQIEIDNNNPIYRGPNNFEVTIFNNGPDDYFNALGTYDNLTVTDSINSNIISLIAIQNQTDEIFSGTFGFTQLGSMSFDASIPFGTLLGGVDSNPANNDLSEAITVLNHIPSLTTNTMPNAIVGVPYSENINIDDGDVPAFDSLIFSFVGTCPMTVSSTSTPTMAEIEWANPSLGTTTCTLEIDDGNDITTESISVTVLPDQAIITFTNTEAIFGDNNAQRLGTEYLDLTIENVGTQTLTNIVVELHDKYGNTILSTPYNPIIPSVASPLSSNGQDTISMSITIPEDANAKKTQIGSIYLRAENATGFEVTDEIDAFVQAESFLEIEDADVFVDGDKESCSGTVEVKEGDELEFEINIENIYNNEEIENVYIEISDNNGWDIDEESNEYDIDGGDDKSFTITFTLDEELDEDETQITIEVFGEDETNNFEHYASLSFDLEIDRDDDEIAITEMDFLTNPIYNDADLVDLEIEIRNIGTDDQDEAAIRIFNQELSIDMKISDIEIDDGKRESERFSIDLPENISEGSYVFTVYAYYNDNSITDTEFVTLEILSYGTPNSEENNEEEIIVNPEDNNNNNNGVINNPTYGTSTRASDSAGYLILLLLIVLIAIAGIVFFALDIIKSNNKAKARENKRKALANKKAKSKKTSKKTVKKTSKKVTKNKKTKK